MTIDITTTEKQELTRATLDRILYCPGYKEKLIELNQQFNPHQETKHSYSAINNELPNFRFSLDKAIT